MLVTFAFNLIVGLVLSTVFFVGVVINIVTAYQASFLSGLLFFAVAMLGAVSMTATYMFFIVGTLGGGGFLLARQAYLTSQRQRQRLHAD